MKSWICQLDTPIDSEKKIWNLIRAANLYSKLKVEDEYSLNFVLGCILGMTIKPKKASLKKIE